VNGRLRASQTPAKACSRCYVIKALRAFPRDRSRPDGYFHQCLVCNAEREAARRLLPHAKAQAAGNARRYRALKYGAEFDGHLPEDIPLHWEAEDLWCCVACGGPAEHIDHLVPLILGGAHALDNLQPLCADHNLSKGGRCPFRWVAELFPGLASVMEPFFDVYERLSEEEIARRLAADPDPS
jgi:5-methylcytosine-specific restriction endonuclease McrA